MKRYFYTALILVMTALQACGVSSKQDVAKPLSEFLNADSFTGDLSQISNEIHEAITKKLGSSQVSLSEINSVTAQMTREDHAIQLVDQNGSFYIIVQGNASQYVEFEAERLELLTDQSVFNMIQDDSGGNNLVWWFRNSGQYISISLTSDASVGQVVGTMSVYY